MNKDRENKLALGILFTVCFAVSIIVFPVTLYNSYIDLQIAQTHGYRALYYSEFANSGGPIFSIISMMFFPSLVGILIGSKFKKSMRRYVYLVFAAYLTLNLLAGDRGSWVYTLIILIWLSHVCYKPIKFKQFIQYAVISFLSIYLIDVIVSLRNIGITIENIKSSLSISNSPIIETIFEMGSSMKPAITLQKYGWDIWPYGNSYLLAIFTMATNQFVNFFDIPFATIGSWFSQSYLGISYGAGFSIVAEALLNFGPYIAPIILLILGFIISSTIYIDQQFSYKIKPFRMFFAVATLNSLIPLVRNYLHYPLKEWFYGVFLLMIAIYLIYVIIKSKRNINNKNFRIR